ncbi:hypothetical protein L0222_18980 [bacterium]|nr:hypothetical protein [bacterium]MCI0602611.1 hypothetical protein [bacterium]
MLRNILFFLVFLFITSSAIAEYYQEDFTSDTNPGQPGFASSVFVHSISGSFAFINAPLFPPDPPDAIEIFNGLNDITFALGAGQQIQHARVGVLSAFGHCRVVFLGANLPLTA